MEPFDFGRFFRGFLGLDRHRDLRKDFSQEDEREEEGDYDQHQSFGEKSPFFTFRVFTDPLEIHKFFEREMEQMFQEFGGIDGIMGQRKKLEDFPSRFEELPLSERPDSGGQTDRDLMLKSESEIISPGLSLDKRWEDQDHDLDDQSISSHHLDQLFKNKEQTSELPTTRRESPSHNDGSNNPWGGGGVFSSPGSGFHSFSFSKSVRTVQKPDGSIETEERTRNGDGTESVIIKRRVGDREETIHQDGTVLPYSGPQDPFQQQPQFPQIFGHLFPGMFGGGHSHGGWGPNQHRDDDLRGQNREDLYQPPTEYRAPPSDRMYSSLFSQFFGDQPRR